MAPFVFGSKAGEATVRNFYYQAPSCVNLKVALLESSTETTYAIDGVFDPDLPI